MTTQTLTITTRINAKGRKVWYIVGRDEKTYATEQRARQGAQNIAAQEQACALDSRVAVAGRAAVLFPNPHDKHHGLVAQARKAGLPVQEYAVVVR